MKVPPVDLTEENVRAASRGRSAEVVGKVLPVDLSEEDVKAASEGRSEQVITQKRA